MYRIFHGSEIKETNHWEKTWVVIGSRHGCAEALPVCSARHAASLLLPPAGPNLTITVYSSPSCPFFPLPLKIAATYPSALHPPFQPTPFLFTITARRVTLTNTPLPQPRPTITTIVHLFNSCPLFSLPLTIVAIYPVKWKIRFRFSPTLPNIPLRTPPL